MTPAIVSFLKTGGTIEQLEEKYHVYAKRHPKYPNLIQFKYDQIESPMADPIVQSARGIILDEANSWKVIAWPFNKFFNLGEGHAAKIDWNTARCLEKLDGSLMIVYYYDQQWHVATSGTPDAAGPVGDHGFTFKDLFWRAFNEGGHSQAQLNVNYTYVFELTSPYNRVVVPYQDTKITMIGLRSIDSSVEDDMEEEDPNIWNQIVVTYDAGNPFNIVQYFDVKTEDALIASFANFQGIDQEGYVVVDAQFNRIKVKHPQYVTLHHMVGGLSRKRALEIVRVGETSEITAYFPAWRDIFDDIKTKLDNLIVKYNAAYASILEEMKTVSPTGVPVTDKWLQKEFAGKVMKTGMPSAPFFSVHKKSAHTFAEYFAQMNIDHLMSMLKLKD